ncbi:MAG: hypothetical protein ACAI44_30255, partial [Candidatus Sericytochromatia bacterium]
FNGFVGEFLILLGVSARSALFAILAALSLILSASYMLWLAQRVLFGQTTDQTPEALPLTRLQLAALLPLAGLALLMGLYTRPFTYQISPAVEQTLQSQRDPMQAQASSRQGIREKLSELKANEARIRAQSSDTLPQVQHKVLSHG